MSKAEWLPAQRRETYVLTYRSEWGLLGRRRTILDAWSKDAAQQAHARMAFAKMLR